MIPFAILLAFLAAPPANKLTPVDETVYPQLIAAQKGNVVLVNFWATWCEPCRAEIPALISLEKKLHADGFKLVLISADEIDSEIDARRFLEGQKASMPSYQKVVKNDDKFIDWLEPKWSGALPALFLYDRAGKKVKSFIGETEMPVLEAEIRKQLSAGKQKSLLRNHPNRLIRLVETPESMAEPNGSRDESGWDNSSDRNLLSPGSLSLVRHELSNGGIILGWHNYYYGGQSGSLFCFSDYESYYREVIGSRPGDHFTVYSRTQLAGKAMLRIGDPASTQPIRDARDLAEVKNSLAAGKEIAFLWRLARPEAAHMECAAGIHSP